MSELPGGDPFADGDPKAREREARRREREQRRKQRSAGARRSLGDRVSGAIGTVTDAVSGGNGDGDGAGPSAPPPRAEQPPAATPPAAPAEQQPAAAPRAESGAPAAPTNGEQLASGTTDDWLADLGTGEERAITSDWAPPPQAGEAAALTGERAAVEEPVPPVVAPGGSGGAGGRDGIPVGGGRPPRDPRTLWVRRLIALGLGLVLLGAIVLVAKAALGGNDTPAPVAKGPKTLKTTNVTIPEGLTIEEMAGVAKKAGLKGNYQKAVKKAMKKFPLKKYDAQDAANMEGFLFPATYEVVKGAPVGELVEKQLEAFKQYFDPIDLSYAKKKNLTPYDVLKIASMIEKEAQVDKDRPLVSEVIYNRLAAGDFLGIDATLRYGLDKYSGQLLQSELQSDNPYNTRTNPGLPPTPISNPGEASMKAAAQPAKTGDYYFVVKPGDCKGMYFTSSASKFEAAAAKYQAALQAEGKSPTNC